MVIALIVTPEGLPLAPEVVHGNPSDKSTLWGFVGEIEGSTTKANRTGVINCSVPTEETPRGRLSKLARHLLEKPRG